MRGEDRDLANDDFDDELREDELYEDDDVFQRGSARSRAELKHSGLGIASFVMSVVAGFLTFTTIVAAGVVEATTPGGMDEESALAMVIGLLILAFLGMSLLALCLGIAGALQSGRKTIFAILGAVFSATTIAGTILLIVVGLSMD